MWNSILKEIKETGEKVKMLMAIIDKRDKIQTLFCFMSRSDLHACSKIQLNSCTEWIVFILFMNHS